MSQVPNDLKYTKSHEWVKPAGNDMFVVGVTDHAQDLMGDMVYVELPSVGARVEATKECAVVESVKAASDVYAPVNGEVTEVNAVLSNSPETVNQDPYGKGWMFKLKASNVADVDGLLDAKAYQALIASESH
jgi:glycine cleavage system H protein